MRSTDRTLPGRQPFANSFCPLQVVHTVPHRPPHQASSSCSAGQGSFLPHTGPSEARSHHQEGGIHPAAWWGPRQALASVGYKLGAGVSLAGSLGSPVGPVWEGPGLRVPLSRLKPLSNNVGQLFMSFITYATCSGFFFLLILLPCYARFSPGLFHNNVF